VAAATVFILSAGQQSISSVFSEAKKLSATALSQH